MPPEPADDLENPERLVSLSELARISGVSKRRLQQLVDVGLPKAARGQFALGSAVRWLVAFWQSRAADTSPLTAARVRRAEAQASRAEHALEIERKKYVPAATAARSRAEAEARIRRRLLRIPREAAPLCKAAASPAECQAVLREVIDAALIELSDAGAAIAARARSPE